MARSPCGPTAAVAVNATAAVAFVGCRRRVGTGEINGDDADLVILPTILPRAVVPFR